MNTHQKALRKSKRKDGVRNWPCTSKLPSQRKNRVYVRGLDAQGHVVFERSFGSNSWFDKLHPVVMEDKFRRDLKIARILIKRFGKYGKLLHDIFHDYSTETGEYLYGECRHRNGAVTSY